MAAADKNVFFSFTSACCASAQGDAARASLASACATGAQGDAPAAPANRGQLHSLKGEGTAEPVRPTGQDSNGAPRPSLSATSGKRPRGIFEDEGLTLGEIKLIATAARWPESCRAGI